MYVDKGEIRKLGAQIEQVQNKADKDKEILTNMDPL